jgi:hypothetical protein
MQQKSQEKGPKRLVPIKIYCKLQNRRRDCLKVYRSGGFQCKTCPCKPF